MYTNINFKTKKAFKEAFVAGDRIAVHQPGGMFPGTVTGRCCIEGPHYPEAHSWYADVEVENYVVIKIHS